MRLGALVVWREREELLNKVIIFVLFAHKKYSRSFVKLQLNHVTWAILAMSSLRLWTLNVVFPVRKLSDLIRNIFIWVLKMNEGLTGLEQHEESN